MDGLKGDTIQNRIGMLRADLELSQPAFAERLGMDRVKGRSTINNWESGANKIKADDLKKIAQTFGVNADWLLGLSDVKSVDENIQTACKITGLSQRAVDALLAMEGYKREYLSSLIVQDRFSDLLGMLNDYDGFGNEAERYIEALRKGFDEDSPRDHVLFLQGAQEKLDEDMNMLRILKMEILEAVFDILDLLHPSVEIIRDAKALLATFDEDKCHDLYREATLRMLHKEEGGREDGERS